MKKNKLNSDISIFIKKLVTHNGSFHADDIFATAVLSLLLEKKGEKFEIIRTRDHKIIENGNYVYDVGGIYDEEKNKFDHHQKEGVGKRENGIEYSSFGLIWKKFGIEVAGGQREKEIIEEKLVAPVDAGDNGIDLVENKCEIAPYYLQNMFFAMLPTWREDIETDEIFKEAVEVAKNILNREIIQARDYVLAEKEIKEIYKNTEDKRLLYLEKNYFYENIFFSFKETLFVIYPKKDSNTWGVKAIREDPKSFKNKKDFPSSWAGLRDEELQKATGVPDAVFCHKALFLVVAKTKEGAKALAELALK